MRKPRFLQIDNDTSAHIMYISDAVISSSLTKATIGHLCHAAFVEYMLSILSTVFTPPLVALQYEMACDFFFCYYYQFSLKINMDDTKVHFFQIVQFWRKFCVNILSWY